MRLVIISGRSGSGKTIALHALEDLGFYCIDNLPFAFLPELEAQVGQLHPDIAVSIDARNNPSLPLFHDVLMNLNKSEKKCEIIYLDADENTLLQRFSETRRKHPLTAPNVSLREAIRQEHELLTPIAALADLTINTSPLNRQDLIALIRSRLSHKAQGQIQILLQSFGFKHGLPADVDFVFDVRCLPNPYWKPGLKALTGLDKEVIEYLETIPSVNHFVQDIFNFIEKWIPHFEAEHRNYITIAIGCTGGQHRSVYMVEAIAKKITSTFSNTLIRHRELAH